YIAYSYFPARYKESNVIVLRKAGKSLEVLRTPRGYRLISLLNISPKLLSLYSTSTFPTTLLILFSSSRLIVLQLVFEPYTPRSP
ncbi:hypothetical protein L249_7439, partial [Ophiocordyceps polyrhachis-furcata BCC 54312]